MTSERTHRRHRRLKRRVEKMGRNGVSGRNRRSRGRTGDTEPTHEANSEASTSSCNAVVQVTIPTEAFGFTLTALDDYSMGNDSPDEIPTTRTDMTQPSTSELLEALPRSAELSSASGGLGNATTVTPDAAAMTFEDEMPFQHEFPCEVDDMYSVDAASTVATNEDPDMELNSRDQFNSRDGLALTDVLLNQPEDLAFRLWEIDGARRITNVALQELMSALRLTDDIKEIKRLPKTVRALHNQLHLHDINLIYGQRCRVCKEIVTWDYNERCRTQAEKDKRKCCGKPLRPGEDHFILLNLPQVLSLVLPQVLRRRKFEFLGPEERRMYHELGLSFDTDFSLTLNYDGVAVFKASSNSVWPILATIDGLSATDKKKHVIVLGVFVGRKREEKKTAAVDEDGNPTIVCNESFTEFMFNMHLKDIQQLLEKGVSWKDPITNTEYLSRGFVSKVLCDSMGRPCLMGLQNLHGKFGCPCCLCDNSHQGKYPFGPMAELRSNDAHREMLTRPEFRPHNPAKFNGIKYKSPFVELKYFDVIWGFPLDAMHCVYLGVVKFMLKLFFQRVRHPETGKMVALLGPAQKAEISRRLAKIRPPHRVSRVCQSLDEAKGWKAHQWAMWLLYYSVPILKDVMPPVAFEHWTKLVYAISILSHTCVTDGDIEVARDNLESFCEDMGTRYPGYPHGFVFNFHLLRHLPDFVSKFGSLPNFSMDPFETFNKTMGTYVNSSTGVGLQVGRGYSRRLITSFRRMFPCGGRIQTARQPSNLSWPKDKWIPPVEFEDIVTGSDNQFFGVYVLPSGEKLTSRAYTRREMKRCADVAILRNGHVAIIEIFVRQASQRVFAVARDYELAPVSSFTYMYTKKEGSCQRRLVPVEELEQAMIVVPSETSNTYYMRFVTAAENMHS